MGDVTSKQGGPGTGTGTPARGGPLTSAELAASMGLGGGVDGDDVLSSLTRVTLAGGVSAIDGTPIASHRNQNGLYIDVTSKRVPLIDAGLTGDDDRSEGELSRDDSLPNTRRQRSVVKDMPSTENRGWSTIGRMHSMQNLSNGSFDEDLLKGRSVRP